MARGRRWPAATDRAGEQADTVPAGAARRGAGGAGGNGGAVKAGHAIQQARAEGTATPGQPLGQIAQAAVAEAHAEDAAADGAKAAPVAQPVEASAPKAPAAATSDAALAAETAPGVEVVAATTAASGANTTGSQAHEQPQPKLQAPDAQSSAAAVVAAAAPTDGVRFAVTGAAGNAAYANAAPRGEETMLPQIVQSIRLHAVQGTTEARVQLKPEHLGALNITLKVEQNQVTATIQADVAAVRAWIASHESSLRQALSDQGLHLAKLVVQEDGHETSKDEQADDRPRRQPRRRSWRDGEATFEVVA
jgi:flagellar hook-length control protein FliK